MILEIKKYFNYAKRQFFLGKKLNFLILYATSECNFKCRTCFFHGGLHQKNDLTLEEFKKISENLGKFSLLLIGGGEPFLRPDLEEICSVFAENNGVDTLYIPTNGFFTERIIAVTEALLKKFPDLSLSINPSLDGTAGYHNELRGAAGSFDKTIKTIKGLALLKRKYKNLQIIANSVIHKRNLGELKKLAVFLRQFDLDYHAFEIMRGDQRDKNLIPADLEEIKGTHDFILKNRREWLDKASGGKTASGFLNKLMVLGHTNYVQRLKEKVLAGERWPMKCAAGESIAVIYPNGDAALCELKEPVGNLRNYGYNLKEILKSSSAKKQRELLAKKLCSCTHVCFINASVSRDFKTIFKLPVFYPGFYEI